MKIFKTALLVLGCFGAIGSIAFIGVAGAGQDIRGKTRGAGPVQDTRASSQETPARVSRTGTGSLKPRPPVVPGKSRKRAQDPKKALLQPRQARTREHVAAPETLSAPTVPPTEPARHGARRAGTRARASSADGQTISPNTGVTTSGAQANELTIFRNTVVTTSGAEAVEPTAVNDRNAILATGNRYAAISEDNGLTFATDIIDPNDGELYGGFCCDQVAYAVDRQDYQLIFWLVQDYYDEAAERSALRLHMFKGRGDLLAGEAACSWSFEPKRNFKLEKKMWFDYNQISSTPKYLYVTTNVRDAQGEADWLNSPRVGGLIFRMLLDNLDDGDCSIDYRYWYEHGDPYISPVQNAGHTMYLATHVKKGLQGANLRIYSIADGSNELEHKDKDIENFDDDKGTCLLPDGTNPCKDQHSGRMSGFHSGDTVGWLWMADGDKHFPLPYVRVAVFEVGSKKKILEHQIWNSSLAWQLPTVGVNGKGDLGVILYAMGGSRYPSVEAFIRTDPRDWSGIEMTTIAESTSSGLGNDPDDYTWGHYGSVQAYHGCDETFLASAYTSKDDRQQGRMVWFGPSGSGCADLAIDSVSLPQARAGGASHTFGDVLDVTAVVVNQGSAPSAPSSLGYYLSADKALDGNDISFGIVRSTNALDPGESHRRETRVRLPETGPVTRNYYVLACADDPDKIDEITSANNCAASKRTIAVGTAPDLVMESVSLSFGKKKPRSPVNPSGPDHLPDPPSAGGPYRSGDSIEVTTVVLNQGPVLASASFIGYYLSVDQNLDDTDISFGTTRAAAALDPDDGYRLTATLNLPSVSPTATPGVSPTAIDFHIIACADDLHRMRELDERNNCAATTGTIPVSPL